MTDYCDVPIEIVQKVPHQVSQGQYLYTAGVSAHARLQPDALPLLLQSQKADPANLRTALALSELFKGVGNREEAEHADDVVSSLLPAATPDEIDFVEAVRALRFSDAESAAQLLESYLHKNPDETFVWTAAARHFGSGGVIAGRRRFLELCGSVISCAEPPDLVAARRAFALHETCRFEEAENLASKALAIEPRNGSAMHSLFHVLYETARHSDGLALANEWLAGAGAESPMRPHFGWHAAIHAIALGDCDEARRILKVAILVPPTLRGTTVDGPALMWLLHLRGDLLQTERRSLAQALNALRFPALTPLSAACVAFGFAALGERKRLRELTTDFESRNDERFAVAGAITRGLVSWLDEDWAGAEESFGIAKESRWRLGGSHIQQETVDLTFREAAARNRSNPENC